MLKFPLTLYWCIRRILATKSKGQFHLRQGKAALSSELDNINVKTKKEPDKYALKKNKCNIHNPS